MQVNSNFKYRNKLILLFCLLLSLLIIYIYTKKHDWVENVYSRFWYPQFATHLRKITGLLNWSIGDLFYGLAIVFFICWLLKIIFRCLTQRHQQIDVFKLFLNVLLTALMISFLFQLIWGINYHRKGIAWQLNLQDEKYTTVELSNLTDGLINKANVYKAMNIGEIQHDQKSTVIFSDAVQSFKEAAQSYSFLQYKNPSIKASAFGDIASKAGISGYYNPLSGEAQINMNVPYFLLPFITCHEIAHQLGYAKEKEANFVAYLVAQESTNKQLKYAAYLEMVLYANRNLFVIDSVLAKKKIKQISPAVKKDIEVIIAYNQQYKNEMEPIVSTIYEWFLKGNQQPKGMMSYDEVLQLMVAYHRKKIMQ